ncbi:hypothetical protein [Limnobaculum parvum]|nr:hypothetical protein [Limnobaculum parvum]
MTDGPDLSAQSGAIAGSLAGGAFGKYVPNILMPYTGAFSGLIGDIGSSVTFEMTNDTVKELTKDKVKK